MDVVGIGESRQNGKQCDDDEQERVNRERLSQLTKNQTTIVLKLNVISKWYS